MLTERRGFTLIELLVVVSLIVLLIALILPALGRSREVSHTVVCASNEKQIFNAGLNYGGDNRGHLPVGADPTQTNNWSPTWDQLLLPHGATLDMILCPAHINQSRHYWVNSNFINAYKSTGDRRQTGVMSLGFSVRPQSVRDPSHCVAWSEVRARDAAFAYGGQSVPGGGWASICWDYQDYFILQYLHADRQNFVFCDGHVETLTQDEALGAPVSGTYALQLFDRR